MNRKIIRTNEERAAPPPVDRDPYPPHQPELPLEGHRRGDVSDGVFVLQKRLGIAATGVFDALTEYTVRQFKREHHLENDGVATPRVHGLLGLPWPPLNS